MIRRIRTPRIHKRIMTLRHIRHPILKLRARINHQQLNIPPHTDARIPIPIQRRQSLQRVGRRKRPRLLIPIAAVRVRLHSIEVRVPHLEGRGPVGRVEALRIEELRDRRHPVLGGEADAEAEGVEAYFFAARDRG
jgi:hypothetical protein